MEAKETIVISKPVIRNPKVHELIDALTETQKLGNIITIVALKQNAYGFGDGAYWMQLHGEIRKADFYIQPSEEYCNHFALIDQEII